MRSGRSDASPFVLLSRTRLRVGRLAFRVQKRPLRGRLDRCHRHRPAHLGFPECVCRSAALPEFGALSSILSRGLPSAPYLCSRFPVDGYIVAGRQPCRLRRSFKRLLAITVTRGAEPVGRSVRRSAALRFGTLRLSRQPRQGLHASVAETRPVGAGAFACMMYGIGLRRLKISQDD